MNAFDEMFPDIAERHRKMVEEAGPIKRRNRKELLASSLQGSARKKWSKAPAEAVSTLVAFEQEFPECIPKGSKSFLIKTALEVVQEVGEQAAPDFIHYSANIIKHESPEVYKRVKTCRSLMHNLGRWRREKGDRCPDCGQTDVNCACEWGSNRRRAKYGLEE